MWLLTHSRLFDIYFYHKVLFFVWIFTQCNPVRGNPTIATVTKARCYANCLTENPAINETGIPCQTSACKECLGPCESSYPDEAACKRTCKTSSYCQDSCEFLTKVKTLSSIITGDGFLLPTPRNLTVTNRSFTSISLQWEAVKNTNGSPVYLIEMEALRGEAKYSPIYMEEVD
ncbi:uncharacterized protein [Porites lutea]|uniref:uncharacterized protein n=1 Tax=Porites lutea TaxID=51062 RepID=UPI003CC59BA0